MNFLIACISIIFNSNYFKKLGYHFRILDILNPIGINLLQKLPDKIGIVADDIIITININIILKALGVCLSFF